MEAIHFITGTTWLFGVVALLLGLVVGSFLNVVIHRLPLMLERGWRHECEQFLAGDKLPPPEEPMQCDPDKQPAPYNLLIPRSCCPHCGHRISAIENIPLLSWLFLRGRCASCGSRISAQYPLIELFTGLMTLAIALRFGGSWQTLFAWGFVWVLIAAAIIDLKTTLLPDVLTLPLMWAGILIAWLGIGTTVSLEDAVMGAIAGYMVLWLLYWSFKLLTGKEGMGFGDFKLLAALGAWLGWQLLPVVVLLSSLVGAVIGIAMILLRDHDRRIPIPFGPYLAAAGLLAYFYGDTITGWYLGTLGSPLVSPPSAPLG